MMHKLTEKILHPHHKEEGTHGPAVVVNDEHHHDKTHVHTDKHHDHVHTDKHATTHTVVNEGVVTHETIVQPAIIDETIRTDTIVEVQPIIHKEVEKTVIHHVEKHIVEPALPSAGGVVKIAPIIQEHVTTRVIEDVQPVIHREVAVQRVEKVEEHVTEHVVAPTVHTTEIKPTTVLPTTVLPPQAGATTHVHHHTTEHAHKHPL